MKKLLLLFLFTGTYHAHVLAQYTVLPAGGTSPIDFPSSIVDGSSNAPGLIPFDFDQDGDIDYLAPSSSSSSWQLIRNDAGTYVEVTGTPYDMTFVHALHFRVMDYDNDGDDDIIDFIAGGDNTGATIFRNDGGSLTKLPSTTTSPLKFTQSLMSYTGASGERTALVIDYDNDGDQDLLAVNTSLGSWHKIENDGAGNFTEQPSNTVDLSIQNARLFHVVDYDNDGDQDIIDLFEGGSRSAAVLQNDGSGNFTKLSATGSSPLNFNTGNSILYYSSYSIMFPIDYDVDGDIDFVTGTYTHAAPPANQASGYHLLRNDGSGNFTEETSTTIPVSLQNAINFIVTDYDNDGDDDILDITLGTASQAAVLQNELAPPALSSSTPTNNAINVPNNDPISLTFNEAISIGTGNIEVRRIDTDAPVESVDVTTLTVTGGNTVAFTPSTALPTGVPLYVHIDAGAIHDADNEIVVAMRDNPNILRFEAVSATLPLTFVHFGAQRQANDVLLHWQTVAEQHTSHFEVQRAYSDDMQFTTIGTHAAQGYATSKTNYSLKDTTNFSAMYTYYRLKQFDLDSAFSYSAIVAVAGQAHAKDLKIFPNPVEHILRIQFAQATPTDALLTIYTTTGQRLTQQKITLQPHLTYATDQLPSGNYILEIRTQSKYWTQIFHKK